VKINKRIISLTFIVILNRIILNICKKNKNEYIKSYMLKYHECERRLKQGYLVRNHYQ